MIVEVKIKEVGSRGQTIETIKLPKWDPVRGAYLCAVDAAVRRACGRRATWTPTDAPVERVGVAAIYEVMVWLPVSARHGGGVEAVGMFKITARER